MRNDIPEGATVVYKLKIEELDEAPSRYVQLRKHSTSICVREKRILQGNGEDAVLSSKAVW